MHIKREAVFVVALIVALTCSAVLTMPIAKASKDQRPASTDVSGLISTNTVWNLAGSPYNLTDRVEVAISATLTIEPGVVVNGNHHFMQIYGALTVRGNPSSLVKINSVNIDKGNNQGGDKPFSIDIAYAHIRGGSIFQLLNSSFGTFNLRDSLIYDAGGPVYIWTPTEDVYIERNIFQRSGGIILAESEPVTVYIRNNVFLQQSTYMGQSFAIKNIGFTGERVIVEYNSFLSSDRLALTIETTNTSAGMTAANNYWGGVSSTVIDSMIHDRNDDELGATVINYQPMLSAPHPNTPKLDPFTPTPTPTSLPTLTPTNTSTSTPSQTPTSTPTAISSPDCPPSKVSVLPNYTSYTPYGQLHILVEFCNGIDKPISKPEAVVKFLNSAGEVIETTTGPNYLSFQNNYAPGAKWCGIYLLDVVPVGMTSFVVDQPSYQVGGHSQASLSLLDVTVSITDRVILGRIRNDQAAAISQLEYRASIYNSEGTLIGCDGFRLNASDLAAGQSTSFNASFPNYGSFTDDLYADYDGYHIWADALELGKLPIHLPQVVRQIASTPTNTPIRIPTSTPVITPGPPSLVGNRNILRINVNPVNSGGTIYATWSIPNFRDGEFDKGDGAGFKGPIAASMTVDVPNVTASRYLTLRWRDTAGQQLEDGLILYVSGQNAPIQTTTNRGTCSTSDPNWRGGTSAYTFCVARDMNWTDGGKEIRSFTQGQDFTLTASWDIYGIAGIWFIVEPSSQVCGPAGTSVVNRQTVGTGSESFNIKDMAYGGYKTHLRIKRSDGAEVDFNEKFLCIGNTQATPVPIAIPTATPLSGN